MNPQAHGALASDEAEEAGPMRAALSVLHAEHRALDAVLRALTLVLARSKRDAGPPDFKLVKAMLLYIDEFPERLHHPKESAFLFAPLLGRRPHLAPILERLERDHHVGEQAIRRLEHLLLCYEVFGESRREAFELEARRYVGFYQYHMRTEEQRVFPAAVDSFTGAQWTALCEAFDSHVDPLAAAALGRRADMPDMPDMPDTPDTHYFALYSQIMLQLPRSFGLAAAREPFVDDARADMPPAAT